MKITLITTGGTIAKTFDEASGILFNERPVIETVIRALRLPDLQITYEHLLNKDSLDLTEEDRVKILRAVRDAAAQADAVVIAHGTDTLAKTGELLCREVRPPPCPIVLTGAMRPYEFRDSDALQNVTEALLACRLIAPGVYVAMHNRVLRFPGVVKDRQSLTFVEASAAAPGPDASR
jgi:L-asparaginase